MGNSGGYNVIVVPDDHSRTKQYHVSRTLVWSLGGLATLLAVVVGVFILTYSRVLLTARQAQEYAAENQSLKDQLEEVRNLRTELDQLRGLQAQVATMLGVDPARLGGDGTGIANSDSAGLGSSSQWWASEATGPFTPRRWPVEGYISKEFYRKEDGNRDSHPGIDIVAPVDAPVRAAGRGRVQEARYDEHFGNVVVLDHGFGLSTLYGHNARLVVTEGTVVEQGQLIAHVGNTGVSSGPHLHFEVRVDGNAVDPRQYLAPQ